MEGRKTSEAQLRANRNYKKKLNRTYIEFYPAEDDLWNHLQSQESKQSYLKNLIRADMEKGRA